MNYWYELGKAAVTVVVLSASAMVPIVGGACVVGKVTEDYRRKGRRQTEREVAEIELGKELLLQHQKKVLDEKGLEAALEHTLDEFLDRRQENDEKRWERDRSRREAREEASSEKLVHA